MKSNEPTNGNGAAADKTQPKWLPTRVRSNNGTVYKYPHPHTYIQWELLSQYTDLATGWTTTESNLSPFPSVLTSSGLLPKGQQGQQDV